MQIGAGPGASWGAMDFVLRGRFSPFFRHFDTVASGPASLPKIRPPTIHINAFPRPGRDRSRGGYRGCIRLFADGPGGRLAVARARAAARCSLQVNEVPLPV